MPAYTKPFDTDDQLIVEFSRDSVVLQREYVTGSERALLFSMAVLVGTGGLRAGDTLRVYADDGGDHEPIDLPLLLHGRGPA